MQHSSGNLDAELTFDQLASVSGGFDFKDLKDHAGRVLDSTKKGAEWGAAIGAIPAAVTTAVAGPEAGAAVDLYAAGTGASFGLGYGATKEVIRHKQEGKFVRVK
jgi:hypothetical protein